MKKIMIPAVAFVLVVSACGNKESKTQETSTSNESSTTTTPAAPEKKTEISVGTNGAEVKTKSGTEVKVGENGVKVTVDKENDK